jgi:hypothetical protein
MQNIEIAPKEQIYRFLDLVSMGMTSITDCLCQFGQVIQKVTYCSIKSNMTMFL